MKKLLLIRHARAEKDTTVKDIDRPLKYTGIQDASFMADRLRDNSMIPQYMVTSPALRTRTTAEIFADHFSLPDAVIDRSIYEASQDTLLKVINKLPNKYDFVAMVGHNPGIAFILYYLTGQIKDVHTSTVAIIDFETDDWTAISGETGKLAYFSAPSL